MSTGFDAIDSSIDDLARLKSLIDDVAQQGERRLPPEPRLSERIGVTRGRLRTLLKRMEDDGLIWRHVGKGTFIGPRELHSSVPGSAAEISVEDIIVARMLLEPRLAAQAAIHSTPSDIAALVGCLEEMDNSETFIQWKRLDERLHRTIARATRNDLLVMLYDTLRSQVKLSLDQRMEEVFGAERRPDSPTHGEHRALVSAIRDHDPRRAEETMLAHLRSVRATLFGLAV